jgi:DNA-binding XRE family transcriptional regulator
MCIEYTFDPMHLAEWMALADLTDGKLAALVGFDRSTISRLRRGETFPSWELAAKIKEVSRGAVKADDFLPEAAE